MDGEELHHHSFIKRIFRIPFVKRYFSEMDFRTEISLYPSLLINLFYAGIKLFSGMRYRSIWFGTLAVYYICWQLCGFLCFIM